MVVHQGGAHPDMCDVMGHLTSRNALAATLQSTSDYFDLEARKGIQITDAMRERASLLL